MDMAMKITRVVDWHCVQWTGDNWRWCQQSRCFLATLCFYKINFNYHNLILNIVIMNDKFSPDKCEVFEQSFSIVSCWIMCSRLNNLHYYWFFLDSYILQKTGLGKWSFFYKKLSLEKMKILMISLVNDFQINVANETTLLSTLNSQIWCGFSYSKKRNGEYKQLSSDFWNILDRVDSDFWARR